IEPLARAAGAQACFNVVPDPDGTVRRYNLAIEYQGGYFQPLAAGMFSSAVPKGLPTMLVTRNGMVGVEWEQHIAPTNAKGQMMINYRGPAKSIPHIPAWKILEGKYPEEEMADKYLLVGVTAPAVFDMRVTPVGVAYPGVEIHATALDSMLHQDFLLRPSWAPLFDIAAIWLLALACLVFLWWTKPVFTLAGYAGVSFGYVWLNLYFFGTKQFWLSLIYPLLSFTLNYLALNIYRFVFSDRQKKQIRSAFGKYLDESVVEQVVSDPDKLKLGGENLELSVLFSDIRGFTGFSEKLDPERLVATLNEYFTGMTEVVLKNKGLLDKYIGDAVMAVFGAPLPYPEHAEAACRTALEMTARLLELNARFTSRGLTPLRMGVGVNTGEAVAGNMGSEQRFSYTVMGKNVNLASRLEGLTKLYGVKIIISADTQKKVGELFWTRPLDVVVPAGADKPVEIFELLAPISEPKPLDYMGDYLKMIEAYREGAFERALETAESLAARHPEDNVLSVYRERLLELGENPPQDWNGVHICTGK
ncbi:MAG: adenylate/guanylate cyclase domain-containing protein, partial [Thermodesulfobacteriota bacterium]|nr:adenylate/guanylate cyclase domain-containing protein [Thermodesulfobacteriota bacterium]